ncbi:hypothetical protein clg_35 [Corynebacterium phage CL31]|nr:hypothetical protein clg_35 [Corynebacterium phage CL31]
MCKALKCLPHVPHVPHVGLCRGNDVWCFTTRH